MNTDNRIIGTYTGESKGPLLLVFGGMHGNEPAGVKALETLFPLLEKEPEDNPDFVFKGRIIGIRGNLKALNARKRFIKKDLNRQWIPENIQRVKSSPLALLDAEDQELLELITLIENEITEYQPQKLIVLDLHTTTAHGGIFSVVTDERDSLDIGVELHAPVVRGLLSGIQGTTLHYFCGDNFDFPVTSVCFESGQHDDPQSVENAIAGIINCMRTIGCVQADHVENKHDKRLQEYSENLPKVTQLLYCHPIREGDNFKMHPGYKNFQRISKGDLLASDKNGKIFSEQDCLILMPLYQAQGDDGFFLIRSIEI